MTPADPSTTGMAATYAANSDFQKDSAAAAVPEISEEVAAVLLRNRDAAFTLVDYGTGPGTSGLALFRTIIDEVRARDSTREVTVVHQDLVGNAWGDLLTRLREDPDSYLRADDPPPVLAAVGSFYRRSLPPRLGALRNEFHGRALDVRAGASFGAGECGSGRCRSDPAPPHCL